MYHEINTTLAVISSLSRLCRQENLFDDVRLPPADIYAALADYKISKFDVSRICEYVKLNWEDVKIIECGVDLCEIPYFDFQIESTFEFQPKNYQGIAEWIRTQYPRAKRLGIYFMGMQDPNRIRSCTTIYTRNNFQKYLESGI